MAAIILQGEEYYWILSLDNDFSFKKSDYLNLYTPNDIQLQQNQKRVWNRAIQPHPCKSQTKVDLRSRRGTRALRTPSFFKLQAAYTYQAPKMN